MVNTFLHGQGRGWGYRYISQLGETIYKDELSWYFQTKVILLNVHSELINQQPGGKGSNYKLKWKMTKICLELLIMQF